MKCLMALQRWIKDVKLLDLNLTASNAIVVDFAKRGSD